MSRENCILSFVQSQAEPVGLSVIHSHVVKSGFACEEAQVYASANQLCTKQKIARGPEPKTYCRLDYAGAKVSKSGNWKKDYNPVEDIKSVIPKATDSFPPVEKKTRKPKTDPRFDLPAILEDLNNAGLKEIPWHKKDQGIIFVVDGTEDAAYMLERCKHKFGKQPKRYARQMQHNYTHIIIYE